MTVFSTLLGNQPILPIIQANSSEEGVAIATAMYKAGIHLVEVVLRTPASLDALIAIKKALPDLCVGAGTITDQALLAKSLAAGSDFIVTPAVSPRLLDALSQSSVPVVPGVSNTADILLAKEYGFTEQKLFPASLCGGEQFLKAVSSVFADIRFCPTGGINEQNFKDYLALNNVMAVGGTWVAQSQWVQSKDYEKITQACLQVLNNN
ncbi:bifunctional 4-hydroxy-2-oxoglutarate aldolase/2-dehydro-3-deoxy-phosphogluconate aldolase [Pseudoalteromonas sp. SR41-4]|jgi:2-dehydro-3-deoxyphosphogluconate aldolase/(4S)-4-hydroxy-2-oxoglutarate aldolase|uniref:bifunctional 4-hydroxy-2-oxoglutarate aldolase/2-dehydro-3-deoxy-phosphogluconate aldolase n=1 Tax=Pseudoalteromonas sp. SR41-4 TaxID=2760950 RepID=UPI00160075F9|nr:bifunctional 4-hydroxy-2-oxoglutarate aldolase/2-dehydro-3-deoxy-phosphogluconate aldolase [Pseudoalteromonas sp. SR41-4]MBB1292156.1 bifunctional 4-hydroxy-2-oxoglutarate aldolase/2-dehydro-3-deoxy-phosphogluconate aldolase [Pseudoalteromonas sp. SR41-4]